MPIDVRSASVRRRIVSGALVAVVTTLASAQSSAQSLVAVANRSFYRLDATTGVGQWVGFYQLTGSDYGVKICRAPDQTIFGVSGALLGDGYIGLYRFDEQTGAATLLHKLGIGGPSGITEVLGITCDPGTGDILFLIGTTLYRVNPVSGQLAFPYTVLPTSAIYRGLAHDDVGRLLTLRAPTANPTQFSLWHLELGCLLANGQVGAGLGTFAQAPSLTFDVITNTLIAHDPGSAFTGEALFPVDLTTGVAGATVSPQPAVSFQSIAGHAGSAANPGTFGVGCTNGLGVPPALEVAGCPLTGQPLALSITGGLGGSTALVLFGLTQGSAPVGAGCNLLVQPVLPTILIVPLGGTGPANGSASVQGTIPLQAAGAAFTMQAFVLDPSSTIGATATNGVAIHIF